MGACGTHVASVHLKEEWAMVIKKEFQSRKALYCKHL